MITNRQTFKKFDFFSIQIKHPGTSTFPSVLQAHRLLFQWLFLFFHSWTLFPFVLPFPSFPFLCFTLTCSISISPHIPNFYLCSPGLPFSGLLVTFPLRPYCTTGHRVLWLPLADVAHHRAQHAFNKPSNLKTPQGTILSASNLSPPICPPCGCQPPPSDAKSWQAFLCLHVVINSTLAATTSEFLFPFRAKGVFCQWLWYKTKMISGIFFKLKQSIIKQNRVTKVGNYYRVFKNLKTDMKHFWVHWWLIQHP